MVDSTDSAVNESQGVMLSPLMVHCPVLFVLVNPILLRVAPFRVYKVTPALLPAFPLTVPVELKFVPVMTGLLDWLLDPTQMKIGSDSVLPDTVCVTA
jgi:hypothetical protein